jgi:AcrR family transcriptional regulator
MMVDPQVRMDVDERREQLLRSGVELLGRRAYEEVSIEEIAAAAGVAKGCSITTSRPRMSSSPPFRSGS